MNNDTALGLSASIADRLAHPGTAPPTVSTQAARQHLALGPIGIALLHIERAAAGLGPWQRAHDWLAAATRRPFTSGADSHPFYGAPALAHVLACAAEGLPGAYARELALLDRRIFDDVQRRLDDAHRRVDAGQLPALAEFDAIRGLTGFGGYLLRRDPAGPALQSILDYCVRLTEPLTHQGDTLPGWWTLSGPSGRPDDQFPGGHSNTGMAHGVGSVLALLALCARRGTKVSGHSQALRTILAWLDHWATATTHDGTWPYWVTRDELRTGQLAPAGPRRPSWCYGTAGIARAQQLAALALGDPTRRAVAENAFLNALTDPEQLWATTDTGLCHGFAGLAHITGRAAADAAPETANQLRAVLPDLLATLLPPGSKPEDAGTALIDGAPGAGLLDGAAGIGLGLLSTSGTAPPRTHWDAFLLVA
ncbi:lanthionine synthetase C family protein (plasmid) [Streptomyces zhihengii]|uniref:Lanthionine synthetase C family protein n=1 Tax=Streptomyces zhihengii TaxID=1818004 RepID=A0ABS2V477_9ACTN|nr:lanthionine synthetase C family protein [Streptomyces zhihengii]MBM9624634.1 lanthionine synthetase C family protein [Streptomyces zhihengii]